MGNKINTSKYSFDKSEESKEKDNQNQNFKEPRVNLSSKDIGKGIII